MPPTSDHPNNSKVIADLSAAFLIKNSLLVQAELVGRHSRFRIGFGQDLLHNEGSIESISDILILDHDIAIRGLIALFNRGKITVAIFAKLREGFYFIRNHIGRKGHPLGLENSCLGRDNILCQAKSTHMGRLGHRNAVRSLGQISLLKHGCQLGGQVRWCIGWRRSCTFWRTGVRNEFIPDAASVGFFWQMLQPLWLRSHGSPIFSHSEGGSCGLASSNHVVLDLLRRLFKLLIDHARPLDDQCLGERGGNVERTWMEIEGIFIDAHFADKVHELSCILIVRDVGVVDDDGLVLAEINAAELIHVPSFVFPHEAWTDTNEQQTNNRQPQRFLELTPGVALSRSLGGLQAASGTDLM
mmetsp:Transcript_32075/g.67429  ORF Transcript_32075/g.67429 Transcript_32075/m.67429 type:complete len:357 (+) Transcript_32075:650-1720(+)